MQLIKSQPMRLMSMTQRFGERDKPILHSAANKVVCMPNGLHKTARNSIMCMKQANTLLHSFEEKLIMFIYEQQNTAFNS